MVKELDFEPEKKSNKGKRRTGCPERNRVRARERYQSDAEVRKKVKEQAKEWKRERRKDSKYRTLENAQRKERRLRAKTREAKATASESGAV